MFYVFLITLNVGVFFSFGAGTVSAQYIFYQFYVKDPTHPHPTFNVSVSYTTKLSDTHDYNIVSILSSQSDTRDIVSISVSITTVPSNGEGGWQPTLDKKSVVLEPYNQATNTADTEEVTMTVPREMFLAVGTYKLSIEARSGVDSPQVKFISIHFTVTADQGQPTVLPKPGPRLPFYGVTIAANIAQIPGVTHTQLGWYIRKSVTADVTKTLSVTNKGNRADLISLTVSSNLHGVTLTPTEVVLDPEASGNVTLTIPSASLQVPAIYEITVTGTSRGDPLKIDNFFVAVYVHGQGSVQSLKPASVKTGLHFEIFNDFAWPTNPIEDLTFTLRLTNTGSHDDSMDVDVTGDIRIATVNPSLVHLGKNVSKVIILTIPRLAVSNAGTYNIIVTATPKRNNKITRSVTITITVKGDISTPTNPVPVDTSTSTNPTTPTNPTLPDLSTYEVFFSEFMFEVSGGEAALPQWFEVYNNSNAGVNLRGWKLQWKNPLPSLIEETATFDVDFRIPPQQSRLIVIALGRYSGVNLSNDAVYQLSGSLKTIISLFPFKDRILGGFSLKLINPDDEVMDEIGTLSGDKKTWHLPECLVEGYRSSLIRRFDKNVPRSGLLRRGWFPAHKGKRLVAGIYYGSSRDFSTPGYRRGKPLPVELSRFSAKFVKDKVIINWTTESELDNAGFNIYRSTSQTKDFQRINSKLIQGAGTSGERNTYQFIDKSAKPNVAYYYRIEDVDFSGMRGTLKTYQLRGVFAPAGKHISTWGTLKNNR